MFMWMVGDLCFQAVILLLMTGANPAVGRDPELLGSNWGVLFRLRDLNYFSGHNKTSMTILNLSIS